LKEVPCKRITLNQRIGIFVVFKKLRLLMLRVRLPDSFSTSIPKLARADINRPIHIMKTVAGALIMVYD
jgi:hypothetical protein